MMRKPIELNLLTDERIDDISMKADSYFAQQDAVRIFNDGRDEVSVVRIADLAKDPVCFFIFKIGNKTIL